MTSRASCWTDQFSGSHSMSDCVAGTPSFRVSFPLYCRIDFSFRSRFLGISQAMETKIVASYFRVKPGIFSTFPSKFFPVPHPIGLSIPACFGWMVDSVLRAFRNYPRPVFQIVLTKIFLARHAGEFNTFGSLA
jgi:hypothetical protein